MVKPLQLLASVYLVSQAYTLYGESASLTFVPAAASTYLRRNRLGSFGACSNPPRRSRLRIPAQVPFSSSTFRAPRRGCVLVRRT